MQIRVVTLRYNEALQGFPEDGLKAATFGREVLNATEHFFVHGNVPHLTLVLSLGDSPHYENAGSYRPRDPNAPNPEDGMTDAQKTCYRALKTWRNETAKTEGRPAYAIARNTQLAELIRKMPHSMAAIREVEGFGEGFCEKYGIKVLELLREQPMLATEAPKKEEAKVMPYALCGVIAPLMECSFVSVSFACRTRWFGFRGILRDLVPEEGSSSGSNRVKRGGSWNNNASNCASSNRNNNNPSNENNNNGFRLVSIVSEQTGFHSGMPALCVCRDKHANTRSSSSASDRRAGTILWRSKP